MITKFTSLLYAPTQLKPHSPSFGNSKKTKIDDAKNPLDTFRPLKKSFSTSDLYKSAQSLIPQPQQLRSDFSDVIGIRKIALQEEKQKILQENQRILKEKQNAAQKAVKETRNKVDTRQKEYADLVAKLERNEAKLADAKTKKNKDKESALILKIADLKASMAIAKMYLNGAKEYAEEAALNLTSIKLNQ